VRDRRQLSARNDLLIHVRPGLKRPDSVSRCAPRLPFRCCGSQSGARINPLSSLRRDPALGQALPGDTAGGSKRASGAIKNSVSLFVGTYEHACRRMRFSIYSLIDSANYWNNVPAPDRSGSPKIEKSVRPGTPKHQRKLGWVPRLLSEYGVNQAPCYRGRCILA